MINVLNGQDKINKDPSSTRSSEVLLTVEQNGLEKSTVNLN